MNAEDKPMEFNPRPRTRMPLGRDQQVRYPMAAEPCIDPDEIGGKSRDPEPEPLWPKLVGIVVALVFIAIVFGTVGVK